MPNLDTAFITAAAVAAYKANGNKIITKPKNGQISNRALVNAIIAQEENSLVVTDSDHKEAASIVEFLNYQLTITGLSGKPLTEFAAIVATMLSKPTVSSGRFGQILWAPKLCDDLRLMSDHTHELTVLSYASKYLGKVKDHIETDFTTIVERYNTAYQCWRYTGVDPNGNLIGFFINTKLSSNKVRIAGRIKQILTNRYNHGKTTYVNQVKEIPCQIK